MKTLLLLLLSGCALDMNGLEEPAPAKSTDAASSNPDAAPVQIDAGAPSYRSDAATSLYGIDQNAAQLECAKTCPQGCCDRSGICLDGNARHACGFGGLACVDCGDDLCLGTTAGACTSEEPGADR